MESTSSTNPLDAEDYRLHQELMEKPKSFFENEPFELESKRPVLLSGYVCVVC